MRLAEVTAVPALLLSVTTMADYVPVHKRYSYDPLINDFSYLGMLAKRDECSDAFGSTARNSNCAPDFTLCCTRDRQAYPSCEKYIGHGWCCVGDGDEDGCYVDMESDCDSDGAVSCSNLEEGTDKACCPKSTTCDETLAATDAYVRCQIIRSDLLSLAKESEDATRSGTVVSATSSAAASSAEASTTATLTTSAAKESTTQQATESASTSDDSISGGAIGGIVAGAVAGVALVAGLVWFLIRRNRKAKYEAANQTPQPTIPQYYEDQQLKYQQQYGQQGGYMYGQPAQPSELGADSARSELPVSSPPVELDANHSYR